MQTLYKDEAITIAPNLDGYLLSDFQHTLGDLSDGFWLERCATHDTRVRYTEMAAHRWRAKSRKQRTASKRLQQ